MFYKFAAAAGEQRGREGVRERERGLLGWEEDSGEERCWAGRHKITGRVVIGDIPPEKQGQRS